MSLTLHAPPPLIQDAEEIARHHPHLTGHLFATSGTTAQPKWILHSQEGLDWCADAVNRHLQCSSQDVWGLALPQFHVGGYSLTLRAKRAGGTLASFTSKWNAPAFASWLQEQRVTITSLVPTQLFDLVQSGIQSPANLRLVVIGGDRLRNDLWQKARELGWPLITSYGMTETAGMIATSSLESPLLIPLPDWNLSQNTDGLLTITGPGLFKGTLSREKLSPASSPFTTTDLVEITDNQLLIKGRADDQIKVLGELLDLQRLRKDLEQLLPDVNTTIIADTDERRGHRIFPVIEGPLNQKQRKAILEWEATLPPFCQLEQPLFIPNWPRTSLGKVNQLALRKLLP